MGTFRTSVFCEVRTQIVGKTKFSTVQGAPLFGERPFAYFLAELAADFHVSDDLLDHALKAEHAAVERQIIIPRVIPVVAGVVLVVAGAVIVDLADLSF